MENSRNKLISFKLGTVLGSVMKTYTIPLHGLDINLPLPVFPHCICYSPINNIEPIQVITWIVVWQCLCSNNPILFKNDF